jgi:diguanylate cyclase (GGDEF)-like protein
VLTELPNRLLLHDRITQAIAMTERNGSPLAVLFVDLDQFKYINDSLGHGIGDALLRSVAGRLLTCVRGSDTVCRFGGDEFVVLLSEMDHPVDAATSAERIMAGLADTHEAGRHQLPLTASIGISTCPKDGLDASTLIECADIAMYHAKKLGPNKYQFFAREMLARSPAASVTGREGAGAELPAPNP